jgi:hypothetical protein
MSNQTWGLFTDSGDLLATVRSVTQEGAIAYFQGFDPEVRKNVEPTSQTVRAIRN